MIRKIGNFPYDISKIYIPKFGKQLQFVTIEGGNHNFDTIDQIKEVLRLSLEFFSK